MAQLDSDGKKKNSDGYGHNIDVAQCKANKRKTYIESCFETNLSTDGNSQGMVISSLASSRGNEVIVEKDNNDNKDNADEYGEDDIDQFDKDMEDTDDNLDFAEEEDFRTKTTPTRRDVYDTHLTLPTSDSQYISVRSTTSTKTIK